MEKTLEVLEKIDSKIVDILVFMNTEEYLSYNKCDTDKIKNALSKFRAERKLTEQWLKS